MIRNGKLISLELRHAGVKGMKWGVRRYQNKDGTLTPEGKQRAANKEKKRAMKNDAKNRKTLSDTDIKKKIERLKLEKQLKDLTEEEVAPGRKYVKGIMATVGTTVVTSMVAGAVKYGFKAAMTRKFDLAEAAEYIVPKPKKK